MLSIEPVVAGPICRALPPPSAFGSLGAGAILFCALMAWRVGGSAEKMPNRRRGATISARLVLHRTATTSQRKPSVEIYA